MALSRIGVSADFATLFARSSFTASSYALKGNQQRTGKLHASVVRQYPEAPQIPLPSNVSEILNIETSHFAPERVRDITAPLFLHNSKISNNEPVSAYANTVKMRQLDSHVDSYDCFGAVSLSGAMQTNVPKPFCSTGIKSTFLNMPGGQWARDGKYLAEDMRKSHFNVYKMRHVKRYGGLDGTFGTLTIRGCATTADASSSKKTTASSSSGKQQPHRESMSQSEWLKLSKKERLKIIVRDYGKTVIVFHVAISLASLGIFYGLVSSELDLTGIIEIFSQPDQTESGIENKNKLVNNIMNQGSTFLIAYAIHKLFAPVRISITLVLTPFIVKYLRLKGILKTPKVAEAAAAITNAAAKTR